MVPAGQNASHDPSADLLRLRELRLGVAVEELAGLRSGPLGETFCFFVIFVIFLIFPPFRQGAVLLLLLLFLLPLLLLLLLSFFFPIFLSNSPCLLAQLVICLRAIADPPG